MKTLILTTALYVFGSFIPVSSASSVFICESPNIKRYHQNEQCKGLQKCTHVIKEVTLEAAKQKGLTQCKLEQ